MTGNDTAAELLGELSAVAGEKVTKRKAWPETPRAVSGRVRRLAPSLRGPGLQVEFRRDERKRYVELSRLPPVPS